MSLQLLVFVLQLFIFTDLSYTCNIAKMQGKLFKALSSPHSYSFLVFLGFSLFISETKTHIKDGNTMKTKE